VKAEAARNILVAWVGASDVSEVNEGPIVTALREKHYQHVHLLVSKDFEQRVADLKRGIEEKMGVDVKIHSTGIADPTAYGEILRGMRKCLDSLGEDALDKTVIQITSGTPAMQAVSIILSRTEFQGVGLLQVRHPQDVIKSGKKPVEEVILPKFEARYFTQHTDEEGVRVRCRKQEEIYKVALRVADKKCPVLIFGETGVGKEYLAKYIHDQMTPKAKAWVAVNCGAIPDTLFESEFFGHEKGAFTGAAQARKGYFEQADGGTLFLDEVGDLPLTSQVKLLRAIQEKRARRVGGEKEYSFSVRIIAATNRDLFAAARNGSFRQDLLYRIADFPLRLPSVREFGTKGVDKFINHFLKEIVKETGSRYECTGEARDLLRIQQWPGNLRELRSVLRRAAFCADGEMITEENVRQSLSMIPGEPARPQKQAIGPGFNIRKHLDEIARNLIEQARERCGGSKTKMAAMLGYERYQTMENHAKKLGIPLPRKVTVQTTASYVPPHLCDDASPNQRGHHGKAPRAYVLG